GLLIGAGAAGVGAAAIATGLLVTTGHVHLQLPGLSQSVPAAPHGQIQQLLRRAGFGARASDVASYSALGYAGAVDRLLDPTSVTDDIDAKLQSLALDLTKVTDMQRWWVMRMIYGKRQLQEKMTLFWHGLLTSSYQKVGGQTGYPYIVTQNNFLRNHAFDSYDNILLGITQDPAMMWWLDLRLSKKTAPNENYARELMELFTLGVSGGYTQADVHDAARALTGFSLKRGGTVTYNPAQHDDGAKTLLGHTGNLDYKDVIHIVAGHPATGPYLCKRLYQFFVGEQPNDADVQTLVGVYTSTGHNMKEVMRALLHLPTFQAPAAYRARLKSPIEFTIGAIRQMEVQLNGQGIANLMAQMGQTVFAPPSVAGWTGDISSADWLNTGTWLARVNFINALLGGGKATNSAAQQALLQTLQTTLTNNHLATPEDVVGYYVNVLIDGVLSDARRATLVATLTTPDSGASLKMAGGKTLSAENLRTMLYLLLTSPEYQLN
nr:DUF1800 domain-containing protein [Ktedonobacterales bacterium]